MTHTRQKRWKRFVAIAWLTALVIFMISLENSVIVAVLGIIFILIVVGMTIWSILLLIGVEK